MSEHDDGNDNQDDKLKELELVADDKVDDGKDIDFFDLDACAESFKGYLQNMVNHVLPEHRIPMIIRLNSMLQEKAKELSSGK